MITPTDSTDITLPPWADAILRIVTRTVVIVAVWGGLGLLARLLLRALGVI